MRGYNKWSFNPYIPYDRRMDTPFIARLAPNKGKIEIEWYDNTAAEIHMLFYREKDEEWQMLKLSDNVVVLDNLKDECEYELYIENENGDQSDTRLARTGYVPGTVINYIHSQDTTYSFSGNYPCSPSIIRLKSGVILASHDVFGHSMPQNLTMLFMSEDNGETWRYVTQIFPCFWGKLFIHNDVLYMLGMSTEYGDILIGKSEDEGKTWSEPTVLFRASCKTSEKGFHKAPCVIEKANGRLWTAVEYGAWSKNGEFSSFVLSVGENDDLMNAENWILSEPLHYESDWENAPEKPSYIEGNVITGADGKLYNCMRTGDHKLLFFEIDKENPEKPEKFVRFTDFEQGHSKFEIQKHGEFYYSVGNMKPLRNRLSILKSKNLCDWEFVCDVVNKTEEDMNFVGFQYPAYLYEEGKMIILSRTAYNGANSFHDNNYLTVHKTEVE